MLHAAGRRSQLGAKGAPAVGQRPEQDTLYKRASTQHIKLQLGSGIGLARSVPRPRARGRRRNDCGGQAVGVRLCLFDAGAARADNPPDRADLALDLVFPDRNGQRRLPDSVSQHFRRMCARLGWKGYTLHSLRKVAITDWRTSGVDLEVAAALAGHKGVKVVAETYSQPTLDRKRAAVERKKAK